jgi:hypothetical protein
MQNFVYKEQCHQLANLRLMKNQKTKELDNQNALPCNTINVEWTTRIESNKSTSK